MLVGDKRGWEGGWQHLPAGLAGSGVGAEDAVGDGGRALALRQEIGVQKVRLAADLQTLARQRAQLLCDAHQWAHHACLPAKRRLVPGWAAWAAHQIHFIASLHYKPLKSKYEPHQEQRSLEQLRVPCKAYVHGHPIRIHCVCLSCA